MNRDDSQSHEDANNRLPHRETRRYDNVVIASHLILTGYGHWLPNDPRGSGSHELRQDKLADLGAIHCGRKRVQPARNELRDFHRAAKSRLEFPPIWFDDTMRQAIAGAFAQIVAVRRYTVWACAILRNHAHLCIRKHRDEPDVIWRAFAHESTSSLRGFAQVADDHPVWSNRPYRVYLKSTDDVRRVVAYIEDNPIKESLAPQLWPFVKRYNGWPHARKSR